MLLLIGLLTLLFTFIGLPVLIHSYREARNYDITQPDIHITDLAPEFDGYRIVHISDIHMDGGTTAEWIAEVVAIVNQQNADMIVVTGDFVTWNPRNIQPELWDALSQLSAPDGVFAVLGNHDYIHNTDDLRRILRDINIQELTNIAVRIERENAHFYLAGVDDACYGEPDLDALTTKMPDDAPAILLAHEPDFADLAAETGRFALQLSGHTHGGQLVFPVVGILYKPEIGKKYLSGYYRIDNDLQVYVTRGVGTVGLPLRLNCRPEITVLSLKS